MKFFFVYRYFYFSIHENLICIENKQFKVLKNYEYNPNKIQY